MKRVHLTNLIFAILISMLARTAASAQFPPQSQEINNPPPQQQRPNLLQELNLSKEQVQQIRRLNQERRPIVQQAQQRLRDANLALDEAIYAENENPEEIESRLREVVAAQSELIKNRAITERQIRKILTPEQLARFRHLRAEFSPGENPGNRPINRREGFRRNPGRFPPKPPGNPPLRRQ